MKRILLLIIVMIFTGCTHVVNKYKVEIDAVSIQDAKIASTYVIKPLRDDIDELKFQRESKKLAKILDEKGFKRVKHENIAEQIIYFDYGIELAKEEKRVYVRPNVSFGFSWGYPYRYYRRYPFHSRFWSDMDYTVYDRYYRVYRLYNRYITIISKDQQNKELWRVDVSSIGKSKDLEHIMPILLKTAKPYIGKNLDKPIRLEVSEDEIKKEDKKE